MEAKNLYRIQVKFGKAWKTGIVDYTQEQAELAKERMLNKGVKCRVIPWLRISK